VVAGVQRRGPPSALVVAIDRFAGPGLVERIEKADGFTDGKLNAVSATPAAPAPAAAAPAPAPTPTPAPSPKPEPDVDFVATEGAACRIDDPDCEACQ